MDPPLWGKGQRRHFFCALWQWANTTLRGKGDVGEQQRRTMGEVRSFWHEAYTSLDRYQAVMCHATAQWQRRNLRRNLQRRYPSTIQYALQTYPGHHRSPGDVEALTRIKGAETQSQMTQGAPHMRCAVESPSAPNGEQRHRDPDGSKRQPHYNPVTAAWRCRGARDTPPCNRRACTGADGTGPSARGTTAADNGVSPPGTHALKHAPGAVSPLGHAVLQDTGGEGGGHSRIVTDRA